MSDDINDPVGLWAKQIGLDLEPPGGLIAGNVGGGDAVDNDNLPPFDDCFLELPGGLGEMQKYIYYQMIYPDWYIAAITSFFFFTHYAQTRAYINFPLGKISLNEFYLVMAKTGFGKERLRMAFETLNDRVIGGTESMSYAHTAKFNPSMPASQQGLHQLLEDEQCNGKMSFLSDEFAEWLIQSSKERGDMHKRAAMAYLMEVYTRGFGYVNVPNAVTNKYQPVFCPRVSIFATTTAERLIESLSVSQAESGTYNRFIPFVANQSLIKKRYRYFRFEPSDDLINHVEHIMRMSPDTEMTATNDALEYFEKYDDSVVEPIKHSDPKLAARLSEQAVKMSGIIALSCRRSVIKMCDLELAYKIRMNLYHRTSAHFKRDGVLTGEDQTSIAANQVLDVVKRKKTLKSARLSDYSRKYRELSVSEKEQVLKYLSGSGEVQIIKMNGGKRICVPGFHDYHD